MATVLPWVLIVAAALFSAAAVYATVRLLIDLVARMRTGNEHRN
jgi:uncharacterized membrane protein